MKGLKRSRDVPDDEDAFAGADDKQEEEIDPNQPDLFSAAPTDYDECLACQ